VTSWSDKIAGWDVAPDATEVIRPEQTTVRSWTENGMRDVALAVVCWFGSMAAEQQQQQVSRDESRAARGRRRRREAQGEPGAGRGIGLRWASESNTSRLFMFLSFL
jgi:hypothetical protein